jgi:DNA-directed RNA polymerase III subunit RPC8
MGLGIRALDILEWTDPVVLACQDGSYQRKVTFRLVLFAPAPGTILTGRIKESSPTRGVRISLGFMDDIYVPPVYMQAGTTWNAGEGLWVWEWDGNQLYMDHDEVIRVRVEHEEWNVSNHNDKLSSSSATPDASTPPPASAPYQLLCSMTVPGLGLTSWWDEGDASDVDAMNASGGEPVQAEA